MPDEYHVFLSYSRADTAMMRQVTKDLRDWGFNVWNDERLEPGTDSWKNAIQAAIEASLVVVVLLSPDAKKSEWIERELDYARAFRVSIIPVIIRGDTQSAVPFLLISEQYADIRQDYQAGLQALQEALCDELKLPELCPEQIETAPELDPAVVSTLQATIAVGTPKITTAQQKQAAATLHIWNPLDYVRLLGLCLFNPAQLDRYQPGTSRAMAVWLASTLFWLPLAINALAYHLSEVPFWGFSQRPLAMLPSWLILITWLLTGLIGQIDFDVPSGLRAFLRGPLQLIMIPVGLAVAVLYVGSTIYAQPVLEARGGLVYLLASQAQELLIIAGGLSAFVGAILAINLARGVASWLGLWLALGFLLLYGLLLYLPVNESIVPLLSSNSSESDITGRGIVAFSGVTGCLGALLLVTSTTIGGALRKKQVGRFNFLLLAMLVAAYGILVWIHLIG